jgi:hypothetical protein
MHSQEWQDLYQLAISEQNTARLPQRIADARGAILDRIEERITRPDSDERRMLNDALNGLRGLQLECERRVRKIAG